MEFCNCLDSIGIFDSGFGGLTVMKAIRALLPHENIVYYGDTAHLPYGTKSKETVTRYAVDIASFLCTQNIKLLVVACHTACAHALVQLQQTSPLPVIGITTATIEEVARLSPKGSVVILGTRGTIASGIYQEAIQKFLPSSQPIGIACQLLVSLVEEGYIDHPMTKLAIHDYLSSLDTNNIDTLILGCTHFPLLHRQIQQAVASHIHIIDPSHLCAQLVKKLLTENKLLNPQQSPPHDQFFVSDHPEQFCRFGESFLGYPILKKSVNFFHTPD
jgi:glutamate racemase